MATSDLSNPEPRPPFGSRIRGLFANVGPGLITGAADADPAGIGTYSQVGAAFGYGLLWTALVTLPMMIFVQELCARIALRTGEGLGAALRHRYPPTLVGAAVLALFVANSVNLGADLGAVAAGFSLLSLGRVSALWLIVPLAAGLLVFELFATYATLFRVFRWLTFVLLAYVATLILVHPPLVRLLVSTFVPEPPLTAAFLFGFVAILGTTISPYLFFWQASSEVDEMKAHGEDEGRLRGVRLRARLRASRIDVGLGMVLSQVVMYAIMASAAAVLFAHGLHGTVTAPQAAQALAPLAGPYAFVLFAVGLIGSGLLAIPILSGSAAYALKEFAGFEGGLDTVPSFRSRFYATIVVATVIGATVNLLQLNIIYVLLVTAVINGVVAPPLLMLIIGVGSSKETMGAFASDRWSRAVTWATAGVMAVAAGGLAVSLL